MSDMRETCGFPRVHPFTIKWVDEEGDPCTISSQRELSEAIRLYEVNKEAELTVHGKTFFLNKCYLGIFDTFWPHLRSCFNLFWIIFAVFPLETLY